MSKRCALRRWAAFLILASGAVAAFSAGPSGAAAGPTQPVIKVAEDHTSVHEAFSSYMGSYCPTRYGFSIQHVQLAELGIDTAIGGVARMETLTPLEVIGRDVIPRIAGLQRGGA